METNGKILAAQLAVTSKISVQSSIGIPEWWPSGHRAGVVLAHDTGTDMNHPFLLELQESLTEKGFLNIRFNFPFAEDGKKRPDPSAILERCYKTAIQALLRNPEEAPALLIFGGVGLGGRVASQVIASGTKADGLFCISYPLHPAGKPSQQKNEALFRIICPILFAQGSRDSHCRVDRLQLLQRRIGAPTQIVVIEDADHELNPVRRSQRTAEDLRGETRAAVEGFLRKTAQAS